MSLLRWLLASLALAASCRAPERAPRVRSEPPEAPARVEESQPAPPVLGDVRERFRHLVRCRNEMTERHNSDPRSYPRDNRTGFYMNPLEVEQVQRAADENGVQVTAVYHSHVGAGAYLSDLDLRHAEDDLFLFPRADWIVLAVVENRIGQVALFRRSPEGFRGHPVESVLA